MTAATPRSGRGIAIVVLVALVLTAALVVRILLSFDWEPTAFVGFGEDAPAITEYAERHVGEVVLRRGAGHDGKFFFVQAIDPLVIHPQEQAEMFDFPVHRNRRVLYPLIAGGAGLFSAEVIVWSLVISNIVWIAVGTWGTARLAMALGGSPWWGLAFALNIGLILTLIIDGAGILALALAVWALVFLYERRMVPAVTLLAGAALSREVMLICALGVAVWLWTQGRRRHAVFAFGIPAAALAVWEAYLRHRFGPDSGLPGSFGPPFAGIAKAVVEWARQPVVLLFGLCLVLMAALLVRRWWVGRSPLSWAFVGFVPVAILFTAAIWTEFFDFTRVLAPLFTASILVVFVEDRSSRGEALRTTKLEQSRPQT